MENALRSGKWLHRSKAYGLQYVSALRSANSTRRVRQVVVLTHFGLSSVFGRTILSVLALLPVRNNPQDNPAGRDQVDAVILLLFSRWLIRQCVFLLHSTDR